MNFYNEILNDFSDSMLRAAFRAYFGELGVHVTDWEGLFAEMSTGEDRILVRRDETGKLLGFLLFVTFDAAAAWRSFFTARLGCVEEFWVDAVCRNQGHGSALLALAEDVFRSEGCGYAILTTDTAPDFYRRRGYSHQKGVHARNHADVYIKPLK